VIRAVLAGDTDRFALLLERYRSGVFRIVTRHVPRERVEETAHEVFVRAFRSLGSYGGETPFGHWLSRIAVNACCDFWREHYANREEPLSALSEDGERALEALDAPARLAAHAEEMRREEDLNLLRWAMDRLSPADRTVLTLTHLEGHTAAEAARLLGWSLANLKIRAFRARRKLREILSRVMED